MGNAEQTLPLSAQAFCCRSIEHPDVESLVIKSAGSLRLSEQPPTRQQCLPVPWPWIRKRGARTYMKSDGKDVQSYRHCSTLWKNSGRTSLSVIRGSLAPLSSDQSL